MRTICIDGKRGQAPLNADWAAVAVAPQRGDPAALSPPQIWRFDSHGPPPHYVRTALHLNLEV